MTSFSRLETNILAKFVDTTFIFRNARTVARGAVKEFNLDPLGTPLDPRSSSSRVAFEQSGMMFQKFKKLN